MDVFSTQVTNDGSGKFSVPRCAFVGIHPSSEIDLITVGSLELGVMALVPWTGECMSNRGCKPTAVGGGGASPQNIRINEKVALYLFDTCDTLFLPGPRSAVRRRGVCRAADLQATAALARNFEPLIRLPFMGRKQATFFLRRSSGGSDFSFLIRGVRYPSRDGLFGGGAESSDQTAYIDEAASDTWWQGGLVAPPSQLGTDVLCRTVHVGGEGDNVEAYDELECWVWGGGGGQDVKGEAEAFGERSL